jgi:hypothetical protein
MHTLQACEQLNAWLGGFEPILKRMTPGNFNWFLHTMLFYHTQRVIQKQQIATEQMEGGSGDGSRDESENEPGDGSDDEE